MKCSLNEKMGRGEEMGGRPSKPVAVNKKHLTNAEKEQRLKFESALLSGKKITERKRVREDKTVLLPSEITLLSNLKFVKTTLLAVLF